MTMGWIRIRYREFYDVPRLFAFARGDQWFVADCPFDGAADDYAASYRILRVRDDDVPRLAQPDWVDIVARAEPVGSVPVADVQFDQTRRESVDDALLNAIPDEE